MMIEIRHGLHYENCSDGLGGQDLRSCKRWQRQALTHLYLVALYSCLGASFRLSMTASSALYLDEPS